MRFSVPKELPSTFFLCIFCRVAEALILGSMMLGSATMFLPDYHKATLGAARIFQLLDRKPEIDSSLSAGLRLV